MQVKLLRAQDGAAYYRLGGTPKVKVHVRIVAATNVDLMAAVEKGLFRRDSYILSSWNEDEPILVARALLPAASALLPTFLGFRYQRRSRRVPSCSHRDPFGRSIGRRPKSAEMSLGACRHECPRHVMRAHSNSLPPRLLPVPGQDVRDLFQRLEQVRIDIPPLRNRPDSALRVSAQGCGTPRTIG